MTNISASSLYLARQGNAIVAKKIKMIAHKLSVTLTADGEIILKGLPFQAGETSGAYEARVEVSDPVTTMRRSGDEESIETIKQYQVRNLVKVG